MCVCVSQESFIVWCGDVNQRLLKQTSLNKQLFVVVEQHSYVLGLALNHNFNLNFEIKIRVFVA